MKKKLDTTLSELPDELLNHILSYLPIELAFQMSVLSKRWKIIRDTHILHSMNLKTIFDFRDKFPKPVILDFVDKYLHMQDMNKVNIQKFEVDVQSFGSEFAEYMNTWVERLIRCNVKKISFESNIYNLDFYPRGYSFPQAILSAESLTKLELEGCRLECKEFADIKLVSLKKLSLKFVIISKASIELLMKSCRALERLHLGSCGEFSSLTVAGLSCLRNLIVSDNENLTMVKIDEPGLVRLFLRYYEFIDDHNNLEFVDCTSLKKLILFNADVTNEWLSQQLSVLGHLNHLELFSCRKISSLNISSSRLNKFLLFHRDELSEVKIDTPNLQSFTLCSIYKLNKKLLLVSLNAPTELEAKLHFDAKEINYDWYIDLLNFISVFDYSRLILETNLPDLIIPESWMNYFSRTKSVARFQRFWVDPETGLLDVLHSICPRLKPSWPRDYEAEILIEGDVEFKVRGPAVAGLSDAIYKLYTLFVRLRDFICRLFTSSNPVTIRF